MAARLRRTQPAQAAPPPHAELTAQRPPSPAAKSWDRPNQRLAARICVPDPPSAPSHGFVRQAEKCDLATVCARRGRGCLPCEELLITARRAADMGSGRARTLGVVAAPERLFCRV